MMTNILPDAFIVRMRRQLGNELTAFLHALEEPPVKGIRINSLKPTDEARQYCSDNQIPWAEGGFYLPGDSGAGASILHAAGAFYIQEPAAMLPAAVLNARPGEMILDLCAAPGGKSTQIGCAMRGRGLLVCNEPIPKRAQILSGNIERMGIPNAVVICEWPDRIADRWQDAFDAVLVDAPCSGEGMFRRDPETRTEWTPEKAEGCAARQREIFAAAARLVRPGGRLVYSTCTYNPAENEGNAQWFTEHFNTFHTESFTLSGINAPDGFYTCFPHRMRGEGQFVALFRREGTGEGNIPADRSLPAPLKEEIKSFTVSFPSFPKPTHKLGKTLAYMPNLPDLQGVKVLRTGLHLGEIRGKTAVPDHAAALCFQVPEIQQKDLSPEEAVRFTAGETIPGYVQGWTLMRYRGLAVGWGKGSDGMIKNHYPKGLRSTRLIP